MIGFFRRQLPNTAFMSNVIDRGRYSWRFRLIQVEPLRYWTMTIGIWKCRKDKSVVAAMNHIFTIGKQAGYGFAANCGCLVNPETGHGEEERTYGCWCGDGDVVEMHVDLERLELSYVINGTDYGTAFNIEKTAYRAAVNLSQIGDCIEIIE